MKVRLSLTRLTNAIGSEFDWEISGVDSSDVSGDLTGTATVDADGGATISVSLTDATTEGSRHDAAVAGQSSVYRGESQKSYSHYGDATSSSPVNEGGQSFSLSRK